MMPFFGAGVHVWLLTGTPSVVRSHRVTRPVGAEHRLEALGAQHDADHLGERGVVVDHKNA